MLGRRLPFLFGIRENFLGAMFVQLQVGDVLFFGGGDVFFFPEKNVLWLSPPFSSHPASGLGG